MDNKKSRKTAMVIHFNGATYDLNEWTAREEAADKERQLDWKGAFPDYGKNDRIGEKTESSIPDRNLLERSPGKLNPADGNRRIRAEIWQIAGKIRRYWLPGAAALVVGIAIGLSLLSVLPGRNTAVSPVWPQSPSVTAASAGSQSVQPGSLSRTIIVIQTGVFSTRKLANIAVAGLKQQGIAAVAAGQKSPISVLIGTALSAQSADDLLKKYQSRQLPVYKKQIHIGPQSSTAPLKGTAAGYSEKANRLLNELYQISDRLASGDRTGLQTFYNQAAVSRAALRQVNVSGQKPAELNRMTVFDQDADQAIRALQSALKSGKDADFTVLQQSLLELVAAYQDLVLHL